MKKILMSRIIKNFFILFISLLLNEMLFRVLSNMKIFDYSTIRIIISSSILSLIFSYISSYFNDLVAKIINIFITFIISFYSFLQLGFKNFLGVYASVQTSSQLGAVTSYIKDFLKSFKLNFYLNLIPIVLIILYYIFISKKIKYNKNNKDKKAIIKKNIVKSLVSLIILMILLFSYYKTLTTKAMQNNLQTVSNKKLFMNPSNPTTVVSQFGLSVFGILDVKSAFFPVEEKLSYVIINNNEKSDHNSSRVIDDTKWKEIIADEKNETYNTLNNYFINQKITDKNEYTGLFKNKNLIVILMESTNDIIINQEYYPNFYNLLSNGWYFENNYSPRNSCATMNNEMSGMVSLYSIYNTCTANKYKSNQYYESVFWLFNNAGYDTFSAHDYTAAYYDRKTIHGNMGSNKYYGVNDLGISYSNEYRNWASDEDFMTEVSELINDYEPGTHFMTWLTTVSSHQPYSVSSTESDKYYELFTDVNTTEDVKRYMAKLKILDNSLGILIDNLKKQGILEDTVILLYGDHYPYGIKTSNLNTVLDYDTSVDYNAERVPLVIYNSEIKPKIYKQYTSYINILPTVANLFDLNYDPRLYVGEDMFSKDFQSLVTFADGSWKNENAFYNASNTTIKYYNDFTYNDEEIININNNITNKMNISSSAIKSNYFNYLNDKFSSQ